MDRYDPLIAPDPKAWLALDAERRGTLVREWHAAAGLAETAMHASMQTVVENQVAENDPPIVAVRLRQLMNQGLDRHAALHAIMSVLATRFMHDMRRGEDSRFSRSLYEAGLRRLSARTWLSR